MLRLGGADDVEDSIGAQPAHPIADRGEIGRRIAEAVVGLLDYEWERLPLPVDKAFREDAERALALDEETLRAEIVDDVDELGVVRALASEVIVGEQDAELGVDLVEVADALCDEHPPEPKCLFVTGLQRDDPAARTVAELSVPVE